MSHIHSHNQSKLITVSLLSFAGLISMHGNCFFATVLDMKMAKIIITILLSVITIFSNPRVVAIIIIIIIIITIIICIHYDHHHHDSLKCEENILQQGRCHKLLQECNALLFKFAQDFICSI